MPKPIALILLNWNTPEYTADCIKSVLQYCNEDHFDILVTDNGSTDGSLTTLQQQFPDLIYIDNGENLGFAEGNNRAINYSISKGYAYSLIMNTDTLVDTDIISELLQHMQSHPEAAAAQPAIYWMHDKTKIWNGDSYVNFVLGFTYNNKDTLASANEPDYKKVEWVTGCCSLIRNDVLKKTGGFNKQFFLYYEDVELSFRLRKQGYELHYLPSCKMYHEAGASGKEKQNNEGTLSPVIHYYVNRNKIWFLRGYGKPLFYPLVFLYNAPYYIALYSYFKLRGRNKKAEYLLKGLKDGFFTPKNLIWPSES
jgi:GT2 family glycosyltransferase